MTDPVYNKKAPPAANKTRQCRTSGNSFHEFKSDWSLVRICRIFLKLVSSLKRKTNSIWWQAPNHPSLWFATNKKSLLPPDSNRESVMYSTDGEQPNTLMETTTLPKTLPLASSGKGTNCHPQRSWTEGFQAHARSQCCFVLRCPLPEHKKFIFKSRCSAGFKSGRYLRSCLSLNMGVMAVRVTLKLKICPSFNTRLYLVLTLHRVHYAWSIQETLVQKTASISWCTSPMAACSHWRSSHRWDVNRTKLRDSRWVHHPHW